MFAECTKTSKEECFLSVLKLVKIYLLSVLKLVKMNVDWMLLSCHVRVSEWMYTL